MPRYVALLRDVSPMNAQMSALKRCFERAGFTKAKTILSSGNVAFAACAASEATQEKKIEAAMQTKLGRNFHTLVRSRDFLSALVATDPYGGAPRPVNAKRVVRFLRKPHAAELTLPIQRVGAQLLSMLGR